MCSFDKISKKWNWKKQKNELFKKTLRIKVPNRKRKKKKKNLATKIGMHQNRFVLLNPQSNCNDILSCILVDTSSVNAEFVVVVKFHFDFFFEKNVWYHWGTIFWKFISQKPWVFNMLSKMSFFEKCHFFVMIFFPPFQLSSLVCNGERSVFLVYGIFCVFFFFDYN